MSDLKYVVQSRFFWIILFCSLTVRVFFTVLFLPTEASVLGQDEYTYAKLAGFVSAGLPVSEFPTYGQGLYNSAKSFIIPASILIKFGIGEIFAVRVIANLYGLLSSLSISMIMVALHHCRNDVENVSNKRIELTIMSFCALYTFFPSNFLWSTLGLRESASHFWIITSFYFLLKISIGSRSRLMLDICFALAGTISLIIAFGARKETAFIFALSMIPLTLGRNLFSHKVYIVALLILTAVSIGHIITANPAIKTSDIFFLQGDIPSNALLNSEVRIETLKCNFEGQVIELSELKYVCTKQKRYSQDEVNPLENIKNQFQTLTVLERQRSLRALDANSALPSNQCENSNSLFRDKILCNLEVLPYRLFAFLFRPLPLIDSGSSFYILAGIENLFWLFILIYTMRRSFAFKEGRSWIFINLVLLLYVVTFSSLASLYEGNLGTAFRHKSTVLWPLVILMFMRTNGYGGKSSALKLFKFRKG